MPQRRLSALPRVQRGATLVIALVILVLIMIIGITAVTTSNTQYRLAGNLQFEDSALNNAEAAVAAAESWLAAGQNFRNAGFTTYARNVTPQIYPIGAAPNPLAMDWIDSAENVNTANSVRVGGNVAQRYFIEQMSINSRLQGSSQVVGGRSSAGCNQVNTYLVTGRGTSARGATKFVQSYFSVLSC